jgi:hypothetical protein
MCPDIEKLDAVEGKLSRKSLFLLYNTNSLLPTGWNIPIDNSVFLNEARDYHPSLRALLRFLFFSFSPRLAFLLSFLTSSISCVVQSKTANENQQSTRSQALETTLPRPVTYLA